MTRPVLITANSPHLKVSNSRGLKSPGFFTTPQTSDHFVDANKMIQISAGPFSRRWENGHFDDSNSIEFDGIKITPTFATSRPFDHFVGINKMVGTASREPLEFERFGSAPQPQRGVPIQPRATPWGTHIPAYPKPQRGALHQPRATPWVKWSSPFLSPERAA